MNALTLARALVVLASAAIGSGIGTAAEVAGRFAPPAGKVLVFAGQDNASVGGTVKYQDGYVDNIGVPGGITHYVYFSEGWTNGFGRTFPMGVVAGLNSETEWASGPMHQKAYLDSPVLDPCVMHVSIAMEGNCEDKVADGSFDHLIAEFVKFIGDHPEHPFLIRIGYEFDGGWNKYDPENFKKAFRRIVDALRAAKLTNFATVFASSSSVKPGQFEEYDPGADYYEWVGYSWWGGDKDALPALEFARKVGKPVFIAEATPRGHFFDKEDHEEVWNKWFEKFFRHIEENIDVIRAVSYINADWDAQDMWDGWGQTRIETAPYIKGRWLEKMTAPRFINAADQPFEHIGFAAGEAAPAATAEAEVLPYKNPSLPVEARVEDLLGRMTLDEKVAQITGWWHYDERKMREEGAIYTPEFWAGKCPHGIGELGPLHNLTVDEDARMYAAVQDYFRTQTRLGIPAILHDEAAHGFMKFEANSFPAPIGLACTWNPDLLVEIYTQAAREARSRGVSHVLSPVVDLARDLRWGRVDETLGEDPFLVGRLGAAMVRGLQGSADGTVAPGHVAATLKHFAGYAGTEGGRNRSPYSHGPRYLLDNEVAPFRHIIQTVKPATVMAAFNEVDGLPCHVNPWMLTDVLRQRIGFDGITVGDYQGLDLVRRYQKMGSSDAEVGRMALEAGLQLELPNNFGFKHLPKLVKDGAVGVDRIDAAVRAVLALKFRLGLFEAPSSIDVAKAKALSRSPKATELAREAARQSIVLLKNDGLLPLTPGAHRKIAVIGPNADICRLGNYSGKPLKTVTLFEGIRTHLGDEATVTHAEGCKIAHNDTGDSYENWRYVNEVEFATVEDNQALIDEAAALAMESDLVVLALGENVLLGREAWGGNHVGDRATFDLTASQEALAEAVLATNKPVVLVLNNGKPVTLNALGDRIPAILTLHFAGQETGTAAAEILFGQTSPSGKLTVSWPRTVGHLPSHYSQHGSAQVFEYVDSPRGAAWPFGHGLGYTTFAYENATLSADTIRAGEAVEVSFEVTNTGERPGTEIAQLYVSGEEFAIARPQLELKGFTRVTLNPGETRKVTLRLDADDLHFHDASLERVLPKGKYLVRVGGSSADLGDPLTLSVAPGTSATASIPKPHSGSAPRAEALPPKPRAVGRPNVLFIAIDDLRPELGTYGTKVVTPHIDRFAGTGMQFNRAYCQQAVCGASRLSIMGGRYPVNTGEQTFHVEGWRDRHPDLLTLNQHFGAQGFQTVGLGKIYHGHRGPGVDLPNWKRWIDLDAPDYALPKNKELLRLALAGGAVGNAQDPAKGPTTEMADVPDDTYLDGMRAAKAVEVLKELADGGEPFFFALGFAKPHLPFAAPKKYWDLYRRDDFAMPPNQGIPPGYPKHAANLPAHEMQKYSDFEGKLPTDFSGGMNRRLLHGYAAATSYADACVGRVLDALDQSGLAENTIVVLWGDHGWKLGDHATWCKHTNFECDTRVPLIIRDPRLKGGQATPRLVELIDLYPTLCDLTGIPTPSHCQGRSFRPLLSDPTAGHRYDAYSSYPAGNTIGHSLRFGNHRYTEWRDNESGAVTARVLTDLSADPGEVTNVADDPAHAEALSKAVESLKERVAAAKGKVPRAEAAVPAEAAADAVRIDPSPANRRQTIDGFGGSIAFWGTHADDEALEAAIKDLGVAVVRVQGEVSPGGVVDHNREILQRAMKIDPDLQILLTFWQPRSAAKLDPEDWLDTVDVDGEEQYALKPAMEVAWAEELVARVKQFRDWGVRVTAVGIQNESNWSHLGAQTCRWEPERLRTFIEKLVKPRLQAAGLGDLKIAAPDLAYIGYKASELVRFLPTLQSPAVDIAAYHMYDSWREEMEGSLEPLIVSTKAVGTLAREHFPKKRLWMTETTGAQWNGEEWHTYGWTPELTEHDKAIKAARYIHTTFADAGANAFLWWGLVYSLAPDKETDPNVRQKHRDEGLVLVKEGQDNGRQAFLERTRKFHVFRQYSAFVRPGYQRIEVPSPPGIQLSAFISPDGNTAVAVAVNDTGTPQRLAIVPPGGMSLAEALQTDAKRDCEAVDPASPMPSKSVRTLVFTK